MSDAPNNPFRIYRRALMEARAYWPYLGLVLTLGLLGTPIALLMPVPLKLVVDNVLGSEPLPEVLVWALPDSLEAGSALLLVALAIGLLVTLLGMAHQAVDWLVREYVAERMVMDFRRRLFDTSLNDSLLHHYSAGSHEPAYRIAHDAPALQWTALYGVIPVITSLASLAGMLYVTFLLAPRLALVALATAVPVILLIHLNQRRMRDRWHGVHERESAAQSVVQEAITGLRVVNLFGQQRRELDRFSRTAREALSGRLRVIRLEGAFTILLGVATACGTTAILYLGVRDVQTGVLTTGGLLLVMGYIAQLYAPLQAIGTHITGQQRAVASAERAFRLLDESVRLPEPAQPAPLDRAAGGFLLEGVDFTYPDGHHVLQEVQTAIAPGDRVGVVGPSGAGKTTLLNLLMRLFDPQQGRILLDGVDLREYALADLRRQFSVVSQEVVLFSGSVAHNIGYGRPGASREEIEQAARLANAHEFISQLSEGYDTRVGEGGMLLSGGQRQRLSLARAFLHDAPILLLDEPTSALDNTNQRAIGESIERLAKGRTVFIIAHQESVLRDVDLLLHVGGGAVRVERPEPGRWQSAA